MSGEDNLSTLLRTLRPVVAADTFVYCTAAAADAASLPDLDPLVTVKEDEGLTMVLREPEARRAGKSDLSGC